MTGLELALACAIAGAVGVVGAITGGQSLVLVPVLILFGLDPTTAVATNMAGITALNATASARFAMSGNVPKHPTSLLVLLCLPGSAAGALIAVELSGRVLEIIIAIAMVAVAVFVLARSSATAARPSTRRTRVIGYGFSAVWAVYGGLFSGGYTTVLTALAMAAFGTTLLAAVAITKVVNLASSAVATALFAAAGVVDWKVALPYSAAMALGGLLGAHWATRAPDRELRILWTVAVLALAGVLLFRALS